MNIRRFTPAVEAMESILAPSDATGIVVADPIDPSPGSGPIEFDAMAREFPDDDTLREQIAEDLLREMWEEEKAAYVPPPPEEPSVPDDPWSFWGAMEDLYRDWTDTLDEFPTQPY
jgi:hypothetical protein